MFTAGLGEKNELQTGLLPRVGVLLEKEDVTAPSAADLRDELAEAGCIGQVEVGIRLQPVTVAAGDEQLIPALREVLDLAVLSRTAQAVELEGVDVAIILFEQSLELATVLALANFIEVPLGMVKDNQDLGIVAELTQKSGEVRFRRSRGEVSESFHPCVGLGAWKVVDPKMKRPSVRTAQSTPPKRGFVERSVRYAAAAVR